MKPELVVIGHVMNEMIKFPDRTFGPVLGGPAAYFSVIACKLGAPTGIVTKIGSDMPKDLLKPLYEAGVDTQGIKEDGSDSRQSILIYDKNGHKTMKFPKKAQPIYFQDIPEDYLEADIIYVAPVEWEVSLEVIEMLFFRQRKIAVDLGGYGGAHVSEHTGKNQDKFLQKLLPHIEIAKLSVEDCRYLFPGNRHTAGELAQILVKWGARVGIITQAEKGAVVATGQERFNISPLTREPIDCTGAGDAFSAGLLFSYHMGEDIKKGGIFGIATASLVIERTGGITLERMPTLGQVRERLLKFEKSG